MACPGAACKTHSRFHRLPQRKYEMNQESRTKPLPSQLASEGRGLYTSPHPGGGAAEGHKMRERLDAIDWKILTELQRDGRITNVELSRRVGISAPPCLRRMRALEDAGVIRGYRALLDEKRLGYEVVVFAMVHLTNQAETDLAAFDERVRGWPLVRECWMLSGEVDFILKCV